MRLAAGVRTLVGLGREGEGQRTGGCARNADRPRAKHATPGRARGGTHPLSAGAAWRAAATATLRRADIVNRVRINNRATGALDLTRLSDRRVILRCWLGLSTRIRRPPGASVATGLCGFGEIGVKAKPIANDPFKLRL